MDTYETDPCLCSLRALHITDYEKQCRRYMFCNAPNVKWALLSLEILARDCKRMTDRNGIEHNTDCLFRFLKDFETNLPFQRIGLRSKQRYMYFKKKLLDLLEDNLFNDYIAVAEIALKTCQSSSQIEVIIRKFLKLCHVIKVPSKLALQDAHQYEFIAELLKICFEKKIKDSSLVISLLKLTIRMQMVELTDSTYVNQPFYPHGFFEYILKLVTREKFDFGTYCSLHSRTLWEYSRTFSVATAVSFGNWNRTLTLLQHGFQVFSDSDLNRSGHGFPYIEETMPSVHLMILHMMSSMRSMNLFILRSTSIQDSGLYTVTNDQMECFRLLWRAIPDPYVKQTEIASAISNEYFHLARHTVLDPMRYEKNTKFCIMYEMFFMDMVAGPKEPRSLKHLCRCTIRESLRRSWNLPTGIFHLDLPKSLESFVNLETD